MFKKENILLLDHVRRGAGTGVLPLGIELAQQGHAPPDPVLLRVVGGQRHGDDEIRGMARGGQRPSPLAGLVQRRHIAWSFGDVRPPTGLQPHLEGKAET